MKTNLATAKHQLPTRTQIAKRAYQIHTERGLQSGHELDNWLQAEYELMRLPVHEIAKLNPNTSNKHTPYPLVALVQAAMALGATGMHSARWG